MLNIRQRILATVAYADIFDYPLTREEIAYWCIGSPVARVFLPRSVRETRGFVCLGNPNKRIEERQRRAVWSGQKLRMARRVGMLLRTIPTVDLVGVTGGVAANNATYRDDIDIFVISRKGTLWSTRLFVTLLVDILGKRRRPGDRHVQDKLCLNMFMSDDALALPKSERDLFAAHEVLQMIPLYQRRGAYQKFLIANIWIRKLLPNAWGKTIKNVVMGKANDSAWDVGGTGLFGMLVILMRLAEYPARAVQLWYMRGHRTGEVVTDKVLRFHPRDARPWVKRKLALRLARFGIPLDKVFYSR